MPKFSLPRLASWVFIITCGLFISAQAQVTECEQYDEYAPLPVPLAGELLTPAPALGIGYTGDYALVACGEAGLVIYNVTDPESPQYISTLDTPGTAYDVIVDEDLVLVADGFAGVHLVDLSNLSDPAISYTVDTPGDARALALTRTD